MTITLAEEHAPVKDEDLCACDVCSFSPIPGALRVGRPRLHKSAGDMTFDGMPLQALPAARDLRWARWTVPLRKFLGKPRTWVDIAGWCRESGTSMTGARELLGWLAFNDLVQWDVANKTWVTAERAV